MSVADVLQKPNAFPLLSTEYGILGQLPMNGLYHSIVKSPISILESACEIINSGLILISQLAVFTIVSVS